MIVAAQMQEAMKRRNLHLPCSARETCAEPDSVASAREFGQRAATILLVEDETFVRDVAWKS